MVVAHIKGNGLSLETDRWGGPPGRREDLDSSQRIRGQFVAYHLAPAIMFWMKIGNAATTNIINEIDDI